MKHALLVGVADAAHDGLRPGPNLAAMTSLLRDLGGWTIAECTGNASQRGHVVQALEAMIDACRPGDACLFYFFGHGGVVRFSGLDGELGKHPVSYIATLRPMGSSIVGVLDSELSAALTRLDSICGNVTAILDCCHAASIVRGEIPTIPAPAWVTALDRREREHERELAVESHPRIVRLFGSSSQRLAYAQRRLDGHHGRLTTAFVQVLREAELRCDRLSWDAVAHRVRERVSLDLGTEDQRVVLAGPRERLLFSPRTIELPRSAAFMPSGEATWGWLRAGLLQGVELGDRWELTALTLGDNLEPRVVAEARVRRVELDRCEVALVPMDAPGSAEIPAGSSALLREFERRMPVGVEASPAATAIETSGLLRAVPLPTAAVIARVHEQPERSALELQDADGQRAWHLVAPDDAGLRELVDLLEDRARAHRLESALATNTATAARESTLYWRWGRLDEHKAPIPLATGSPGEAPGEVLRLHVNDLVWVQLCHHGFPPPHWFVSVVEIGLSGRPQLLNTGEPEGIEVEPGAPVYVGLRGLRRQQGLRVLWPPEVPMRGPRRSTLLVLASQRPISLGHLVRTPAPDGWSSFAAQGLSQTTRGPSPAPPIATAAWTWGRIDFEVDPRPRCAG